MLRPDHDQLERARRYAERDAQIAAIAARIKGEEAAAAEMRANALELIAASRPSIRRRLLDGLDVTQADYDEEREFGWAVENGRAE